MRKLKFYIGIMWIGTVLIIGLSACSQKEKEAILIRQGDQPEVVANEHQYVIGPEDVLYINVWKEEALSRTVVVRIDGKISLPLLNDIQAAGLTPLELKENLVKELSKFIESPNVSVVVNESRSYKVFVSGQVRNPGVYPIRSETYLHQIIPMAGGFLEWANPKKIFIIRKEKGEEKRINVDYKKILESEDKTLNPVLKPGDTIIVP